jgi:phosphopantothenoylcysteine decarboxylase / phosphopantothenate---cysteine ligase
VTDPLATLRGRRMLLVVGGGIAAYKSVELLRLLTKAGAEVQVLQTAAAREFVGPATFAALSHRPVPTDLFDSPERVIHVELGRWAEAVVIAPATANLLAQMRAGFATDLVSATLLNTRAPILAAAAMHSEMWEHQATRDNVRVLRDRGVVLLDPEEGELARGDVGVGRMLEPDEIRTQLALMLSAAATAQPSGSGDLNGRTILVTAGGTQEPIDAVRVITNRSSGKMGYALAAEASRRGARVCLVTAPTSLEPPQGVEVVRVHTAAQMRDAVIERFADTDVVLKAAAVADFSPAVTEPLKIKKDSGAPTIPLVPTVDILTELSTKRKRQVLVGFSAETDNHLPNARAKLQKKNLDLLVLNDVSRGDIGFDRDDNEVTLLSGDGSEVHISKRSKAELATIILDRVRELLDDPARKENR